MMKNFFFNCASRNALGFNVHAWKISLFLLKLLQVRQKYGDTQNVHLWLMNNVTISNENFIIFGLVV